jgi:ribose transport system substrate-binding protein
MVQAVRDAQTMKRLRFVLSLTTQDNDFQREQAGAAQEVANRLGGDLEIIYADNDAIQQSQQLLKIIQSRVSLPDGLILEPVGGTGFPQVARAAAAAGIAGVVMNREVEYLGDLRRDFKVPLFCVSSDHEEIGRIQGKQVAALLPRGGSVLLIQGPADTAAAQQRLTGFYEAKPPGVQVKVIKGNWTEAGAYKIVSSWLKLSTSLQIPMDLVVSQNDAMAIGTRKAFHEIGDPAVREKFSRLRYIGIDGVRTTGQECVKRGLLDGTIVVPPNSDVAIRMLTDALQRGVLPPQVTLTSPKSLPSIAELSKKAFHNSQAAGAPL